MNQRTALQIILAIAIIGVLFFGYLSYNELLGAGCTGPIVSCRARVTTVFDLPASVYGLIIYLAVTIIAIVGLRGKYLDVRKV